MRRVAPGILHVSPKRGSYGRGGTRTAPAQLIGICPGLGPRMRRYNAQGCLGHKLDAGNTAEPTRVDLPAGKKVHIYLGIC